MITLLVVLNSIIILYCLARPLLILATALGILLWKLRWVFGVGFIGLLAIVAIPVHHENQRVAKQVQDYQVTHPDGPTSNEIQSDPTLKRLDDLYKEPSFRRNVGLPQTTTTRSQEEQQSKIPQEWLAAGPAQNIHLDPPDIPVTGLPSPQ
jgi:hypothetical protein